MGWTKQGSLLGPTGPTGPQGPAGADAPAPSAWSHLTGAFGNNWNNTNGIVTDMMTTNFTNTYDCAGRTKDSATTVELRGSLTAISDAASGATVLTLPAIFLS